MPYIVCIDPGHGGYDSGAVGNGLREKDLTLRTGLFLRDYLNQDRRFQAVMTRDGDYAPGHYEGDTSAELSERARIANNASVQLFIAIHFNSAVDSSAHGCETLDFDGTGQITVFENALLDRLVAKGITRRGIHPTHSSFAVIRQTNMPAVITESAFINNADDIAHFDSDTELKDLAFDHYVATCTFFGIEAKTFKAPAAPYDHAKKLAAMAAQKFGLNSPDVWEKAIKGESTVSASQLQALFEKIVK